MYLGHHLFSPWFCRKFLVFFYPHEMFSNILFMLFSFKSDGQRQKQSWSTSTPKQHFTMPARSPGDFSRIASCQFDNNMRKKLENQRYVQVPYTHYPLNYGPHFGNFQGIQSIQSQNPLHNGVGLQGNPFVQSYITPMQPGTAVHFSHQMTTQSSEAYNAFTAYNNPFGMFWRPN